MQRQLILEIACLLVTLYATAESIAIANNSNGEECETPDHWEGVCVDLYECPALLTLTEKANRSANETTFLELSRCGTAYFSVYICCRFRPTDLLPDTQHCGQSFHNLIYNGSSTHLNEYPWTALILFQATRGNDSEFCGGTLINNRYVLTAAHCLWNQEQNIIKAPVLLGEWDIRTDPDCETSRNGQIYCADPRLDFGIEEYILHPNFKFNLSTPQDDVALIRLNRSVDFTEFIQPACLPIQPRLRSKTYVGSQMVAIGWGATATDRISAVKQVAYLPGVNLEECRNLYKNLEIPILDTQLCAGGKGAAICFGDSGSPLVYQQSVDFRDVYMLVGIPSITMDSSCRNVGIGIFTKVGSYMDWILENLRP